VGQVIEKYSLKREFCMAYGSNYYVASGTVGSHKGNTRKPFKVKPFMKVIPYQPDLTTFWWINAGGLIASIVTLCPIFLIFTLVVSFLCIKHMG